MMLDLHLASSRPLHPRALRCGVAAIALLAFTVALPSIAFAQSAAAPSQVLPSVLTDLGGGDLLDAPTDASAATDALAPAALSAAAIGSVQASPPHALPDDARTDERLRVAPHVRLPSGTQIPAVFTGFASLTGKIQAGVNIGVDREPASPSIAVANGKVMAIVNNALNIYNSAGRSTIGGNVANAALFRTNQVPGTVTLNDPRVIFDADTGNFIAAESGIVANPDGTQSSKIFFAVLNAASPRLSFKAYSIDTTAALSSTNCPCSVDFVQIGTDQNGLYFSGNVLSLADGSFHGATIYALDKHRVSPSVQVALPPIAQLSLPNDRTVAPSITAPQSAPVVANGGTEYFMAARGPIAFKLRLFALTNTQSLTTATPALSISGHDLHSKLYVQPPEALQPDQVGPLGQSLGVAHAPNLETNTDVISAPIVLSQGQLWVTLSTAMITDEVEQPHDRDHDSRKPVAGVAFFGVTPGATSLRHSHITTEGYIPAPVAETSLIYPSIAMNSAGNGAIGFTMTGPNNFPSAAFVPLSSTGTIGTVTIAAPGAASEDGFTGYAPLGPTARWGDYSAAVVDPADGSIWLNAEYIPNATVLPRDTKTNWGTAITHYVP